MSNETKETNSGSATVSAVGATNQGAMEKKDAKATKEIKSAGTSKGKTSKGKPAAKTVKAAKSAKTGKVQKLGKSSAAKIKNTDGCPYRPTSSYGKLWALLFKHREKGISRANFVKQGAKVIGKDEKHTAYDVAVVASPTKDGAAHPSANRAADSYWVERTEGGLMKLHRR
jgi:hypothetical protein